MTVELDTLFRWHGETAAILEAALELVVKEPGRDVRETIHEVCVGGSEGLAVEAVERAAGDLHGWARYEMRIGPSGDEEIPLTLTNLEKASRAATASFREEAAAKAAQVNFVVDVLTTARAAFQTLPDPRRWAPLSPLLEPRTAAADGLICSALEANRHQLGSDRWMLLPGEGDPETFDAHFRAVETTMNAASRYPFRALAKCLGAAGDAVLANRQKWHWSTLLNRLMTGENPTLTVDSLLRGAVSEARQHRAHHEAMATAPTAREAMARSARFETRSATALS